MTKKPRLPGLFLLGNHLEKGLFFGRGNAIMNFVLQASQTCISWCLMFVVIRRLFLFLVFLWAAFCAGNDCSAQIIMNDGRVIRGQHALLARVDESAEDAQKAIKQARNIVVINDGLRRIFVSKFRVAERIDADLEESLVRFRIRRSPAEVGTDQGRLPPFVSYYEYEPFNEFGRRIVIVNNQTPVDQTITEINPRYVVVASRGMVWDMRIATSSLSQNTITRILMKQINPKKLEDRKRIVHFYIQSERYREARAELAAILQDFGSDERVSQELVPLQRNLDQLETEQIRKELVLRRDSGQYEFSKPYLADFPADQADVGTLQAVRNLIEEDSQYEQWRARLLAALRGYAEQVEDEPLRNAIPAILDEIESELTQNTILRFSPLQLMIEDNEMAAEDKLALAISGWLVGENEAVVSLPLAVSMYKTRENVREYLIGGTSFDQEVALKKIESEEAGTIETITKLLPMMKPFYPIPREPVTGKPGYYQLETPAYGNLPPFTYCIQLPPEYDPNRKYPLIIALHGETTAEQQIDWWAGNWRNGQRTGHATRHGYIVMAPLWNVNGSFGYDYSAGAHGAVLYSYYDALRHFSVDVDRVYLTGHSTGGDAAWDIGISHPDLWAGVMPIVASGRKFVRQYPLNARYVPLYFVTGELDGCVDRDTNVANFNNYLSARTVENYRCTLVTYLGRGHESFSDEILNLIDWMSCQKREFPLKNFEVRSLRPWDSFFWWVEAKRFPNSAMVNPTDWPDIGVVPELRPARIETSITSQNRVRVTTSASQTTVWLSPELVNLDERVEVQVNDRRVSRGFLEGNLTDLLEDVRTRFDRQHPFWLKIDL